jgi:DNA-binding response OmpR family regulator
MLRTMTTMIHVLPGLLRVLLVLNQPVLAEVIKLALAHGRAVTRVAPTMATALATLPAWSPHLAVVDIDLVHEVRLDRFTATGTAGTRLPFIALTRRVDLPTKLTAFGQGADDLLTVPFAPEELVVRTLAVLRRTYHGAVPFTPVLRIGDLEIDYLNKSVRVGGQALHLTALELSLLYLLAANAGRILTRDEILDQLWGVDFVAESNVVDRHVRTLRAKLLDNWHRPRYIATLPGQGYRFVPTAAADPFLPIP